MARRRMIDPNIWQSEDFSKLSLLAKLLFIGMFSVADDYGKGRGKPVYLKSTIFPYDDGMRLTDVEKALSEIGSNMSVTFYAHNGSDYYRMDNWDKWQTVDKPQPSKIPDLEQFANDSRMSSEQFANDSRLKEKKGKEENIKENKEKEDAHEGAPLSKNFIPPTEQEISDYCREKNYTHVNPAAFIGFYESVGWRVGKNKMQSWKGSVAGWENREMEKRGLSPPGAVAPPLDEGDVRKWQRE